MRRRRFLWGKFVAPVPTVNYIFGRVVGQVKLLRCFEGIWMPLEESAGHVLDFHSLRHTFGTNLAKAGVAPKMAVELVRHSDINLTMGTYSHVVLYDLDEAVQSLRLDHSFELATGTGGAEQRVKTAAIKSVSLTSIANDTVVESISPETSKSCQKKDLEADCESLRVNGTRAADETRTHDLRFTKASLCQLSYGGLVTHLLLKWVLAEIAARL